MKKVVKKSTKQTTKKVAKAKVSAKLTKKNEPTIEEMESRIQELESELGELKRKVEEKKKKALAEKNKRNWTKKNATYKDVFVRVAKYMNDHGGFVLDVGDLSGWEEFDYETPYEGMNEDDPVSMGGIDDNGNYTMRWDSVKDFLTAPWKGHHANFDEDGCANIFSIVHFWNIKYYKLSDRWVVNIANCLKPFGNVTFKKGELELKGTSPTWFMKELDRLGI